MRLTLDSDAFLSKKRANKQEKKEKKDRKRSLRAKERYEEIHKAFGVTSKILSMLSANYEGDPAEHSGSLQVSIPPVFSTILEPSRVIALIGLMAKTMRQRRAREIHLDHAKLAEYDLAANALLDVVAVELMQEDRHRRCRTKWRGTYPTAPDIRLFIQALGIVKHLGIHHEAPKANQAAALRVFDVRNRHYYRNGDPTRVDYKSKIVQKFAEHINECLKDHGKELTKESRHKLCSYTGEILDNAVEHSGMVDWSIQGYLDNSRSVPICEIAIFNFGRTIAETLDSLPRHSYTWKQIAPYLLKHRRNRLFKSSWSEADLLTLIALQGHVSSKNQSPADTRGNGSVDLIEFFQKVHSECNAGGEAKATMAILSGKTHILFDGTYRLIGTPDGRKTITFNKENDLNCPPDSTYVKGLRGVFFPGTIISVRFPLADSSTKDTSTEAS